jgi:glucokinase
MIFPTAVQRNFWVVSRLGFTPTNVDRQRQNLQGAFFLLQLRLECSCYFVLLLKSYIIFCPMNAESRSLYSVREAQPPFYVGVDVGGTSIKIGLVDDFGNSIDTGEIDLDGNKRGIIAIKTELNPQTATTMMAETIRSLLKRLNIDNSVCGGIGLGLPTSMDPKTRKIRRPANLSTWANYAMCDELSQQTSFPVVFCNDANAAAFGEYWVGSASRQPSLALLTLGTGIGCGIIVDGRSIDGETGHGGECGHLVIDSADNALLCGCGQRGHLEAYCSATGVARRTLQWTLRRESSIRPKITPETRLGEIAMIVYHEADQGDELAMEIIAETAKYLSLGIVSILHTVDPACVLLGGAMTFGGKRSPLGQRFLAQVTNEVKSRSFPGVADNITIDFAALGPDAGYIGAAGLAREQVKKDLAASK